MAIIYDLVLFLRRLQPLIRRAIPTQRNVLLVILTILLYTKLKGDLVGYVILGIIQIPDQLNTLQLGIPLLGDFGSRDGQPHGIWRGQRDRLAGSVVHLCCAVLVLFDIVHIIIHLLVGIGQRRIRTAGILYDVRHT